MWGVFQEQQGEGGVSKLITCCHVAITLAKLTLRKCNS